LQGTQILGCSIYFIQAIVGVSELKFLLLVLVSVIAIVGVVSVVLVYESSVYQFAICEELHFGPSIVTIWSADEIVNGEWLHLVLKLCLFGAELPAFQMFFFHVCYVMKWCHITFFCSMEN
jgi:hypothetical protein